MENECEALPGVTYPGVRDNRSTLNTKTGYDEHDDANYIYIFVARIPPILKMVQTGKTL